MIPVDDSAPAWVEDDRFTSDKPTESRFIDLSRESDPFERLLESNPAFGSEPVVLAPGQAFAGFEVRGKLGSGGMAVVYRAVDPSDRQEVALKILNRGLVRDSRHLQRFWREAQLASSLRHPRVVTIHTYGDEGGCAYLTMQLVEGPTLAEVVEQTGPLEPNRATEIMEQVARAIDAAHQQRVVHRDLKPSNLILHPDDGPLVLDFGLAKDLGRDLTLTETGEILGTPAYLAPEQAVPEGYPVDHRIDVYGLGATLLFLLTGEQPYPGENAVDVIRLLLSKPPRRLRALNPELPAPLDVIVSKALARDPRDRYQTAAAFADDLARFRAQEAIRAKPLSTAQRLWRFARGHPVSSALAVALILVLTGGFLTVQHLANRFALEQRSQQGLAMLEHGLQLARAGAHQQAEQELLQAMLMTKGAFLEAPDDDDLREALVRVKRTRAEYAESRGNWGLAEELRQNLARLLGEPLPSSAPPVRSATISVIGLRPAERITFHSLASGQSTRVAEVTPDLRTLDLVPGRYLAVHTKAERGADVAYLVVVDSGHRHQLRLDRDTPPPPGVFSLPSWSALDHARARSVEPRQPGASSEPPTPPGAGR